MSADQTKEYLFNYIKKSEDKINELILQHRYSEIIEDMIESCYDQALCFGQKDEMVGILATGILHFLLTKILVPSQRKIVQKGIEIDIVIPDLKTLEKDPEKALVICILYNMEKDGKEKPKQLQKIQSKSENIWIISPDNSILNNKTYVVAKNNTFSRIIDDILQFVNIHAKNKFKIMQM